MKTENRQHLTTTLIRGTANPQPGEGGKLVRTYLYDDEVPGLAFCAASTGRRFFCLCRMVVTKTPNGGERGAFKRITLGDVTIGLDQARKLAGKWNGRIAEGVDPVGEKREKRKAAELAKAKSKTFEDMWTLYRDGHLSQKRAKTVHEFTRMYNKHLAAWAKLDPATIDGAMVETLKARIGATSHYTANRVLEIVSAMYRKVGHRLGMPKKWTPTDDVDWFDETARDRVMSPEELWKVRDSILAEENETIRDYFLMLLYTGQRRNNVAAMKWENISQQRGTWTIAGTETKNKKAMVVTLVPDAVALLAKRSDATPYVFPSKRITPAQVEQAKALSAAGKSTHQIAAELGVSQHAAWTVLQPGYEAAEVKPFNGAGRAWKRIVERAGIGSRLTIHDCRRTYCTCLIENGTPLPVVSQLMNHRSMATTMKHYAFARQEAVADAGIKGSAKMFAEAAAAKAAAEAKNKKGKRAG